MNLKKGREELQLRVAGWFGGCVARAAGSWALAISRMGHAARAGSWAPAISLTDRYEWQQSAVAILQGGDRAVQCREVAMRAGDRVGGRHPDQGQGKLI